MSESTGVSRPEGSRRGRRRPSRPRNANPNAATRVDILKSAAKAFRKLGYHGATVEEIAAALQMKKGNLYYYFKNKEEILFACHQYSLDQLTQILEGIQRGVREVLEEGMATGTFAQGDPKLLAFALFGAVNWIPRWFKPQGASTSQEIADRFADYLIAGLKS